MSNAEKMVMVPRDLADKAIEQLERAETGFPGSVPFLVELRETLAQPGQQHQVEPVALPARKDPTQGWAVPGGVAKADGWNACLDEIAKLGPLYTHADPNVRWKAVADEQMEVIADLKAEAERLRKLSVTNIMLDITPGEDGMGHEVYAKSVDDVVRKLSAISEDLEERDTLRNQLAEAHALLRDLYDNNELSLGDDQRILAALPASAEPKGPTCKSCNDTGYEYDSGAAFPCTDCSQQKTPQ